MFTKWFAPLDLQIAWLKILMQGKRSIKKVLSLVILILFVLRSHQTSIKESQGIEDARYLCLFYDKSDYLTVRCMHNYLQNQSLFWTDATQGILFIPWQFKIAENLCLLATSRNHYTFLEYLPGSCNQWSCYTMIVIVLNSCFE